MTLAGVARWAVPIVDAQYAVANVKSYGAKGDGATDDTSAFEAAIAAADVIIVPEGTYLLSGISLSSGQQLVGMSKHKSILKLVNAPTGALVNVTGTTGNVVDNVVVSNLTLTHRTDFTQDGTEKGILLRGYYSRFITVKDVVFKDFSVYGILFSRVDDGEVRAKSWEISDCIFENGIGGENRACGILAFDDGEYYGVHDCIFYNVRRAIEDRNSGNGKVTGCTFLECGSQTSSSPVIGVYRESPNNGGKLIFSGNCLNHFDYVGMLIQTNALAIAGCTITGNNLLVNETGHNFIELTGASYNTIKGNLLGTEGTPASILIEDDGTFVSDQNVVVGNNLVNVTVVDNSTGDNTIGPNEGVVSENRGTASITGDGSTQTSVQVAHGLDVTPSLSDISVTPTSSLGSASEFYASAVDATNITITLDADPGNAVEVTFVWQVKAL